MNKRKIWISLMVYNQKKHIEEICSNLDWCDGIVAVDHFSNDGTYEILQKNKKNGLIMQLPWMDLHYLSMTACLNSGIIRPGDWVYALDSQERVVPEFVNNIQSHIESWEANKIGCIFWGKPLIFKKSLGMVYMGNPHCFPSPLNGKILNVQDEATVIRNGDEIQMGNYLINKKDPDNTIIFHGAKYYFYEISNQPQMFYEKYGGEVLKYHNEMRLNFLLHLESLLECKPDIYKYLELIEKYINKTVTPDKFILDYTDFEFPLTDAIRLKVLKQHRDAILKNRYNWSFRYFLDTGDAIQDNTSYKGTITKYEEMAIKR